MYFGIILQRLTDSKKKIAAAGLYSRFSAVDLLETNILYMLIDSQFGCRIHIEAVFITLNLLNHGENHDMTTLSAELTFSIDFANSLKEKRMVARSLIDTVRHKFNASVAEVGTNDLYRTLTVGVAVVSGSASDARDYLDRIIRFMEENAEAELISVDFSGG